MKRVFICHCEARHCCGTETECVACQTTEGPSEQTEVHNVVDPDAEVDDWSLGEEREE
jgi:hypothetical protein